MVLMRTSIRGCVSKRMRIRGSEGATAKSRLPKGQGVVLDGVRGSLVMCILQKCCVALVLHANHGDVCYTCLIPDTKRRCNRRNPATGERSWPRVSLRRSSRCSSVALTAARPAGGKKNKNKSRNNGHDRRMVCSAACFCNEALKGKARLPCGPASCRAGLLARRRPLGRRSPPRAWTASETGGGSRDQRC